MGWQCSWRVNCERCKALGPAKRNSLDAEKKAIAKGWQKGHCYGMALHLCPACVATGLPDWWPDSTGMSFIWEDTAPKTGKES